MKRLQLDRDHHALSWQCASTTTVDGEPVTDIDRRLADAPPHGAEVLADLADSARGWHRIQLAVLGFIGFCGVFWDGAGAASPAVVRWLGPALVAAAFVLANVAIFLVGRVAHPFDDPTASTAAGDDTDDTIEHRAERLRTGIRLTYLALALLVAATLSSWFPVGSPDEAVVPAPQEGAVGVADADGQAWCGQLVAAPAGEIGLATTDGPVGIPLDSVAIVRPLVDC
jgi:hypothetical protein